MKSGELSCCCRFLNVTAETPVSHGRSCGWWRVVRWVTVVQVVLGGHSNVYSRCAGVLVPIKNGKDPEDGGSQNLWTPPLRKVLSRKLEQSLRLYSGSGKRLREKDRFWMFYKVWGEPRPTYSWCDSKAVKLSAVVECIVFMYILVGGC